MTTDLHKTLAGLLLAGASLLSGNAVLIATAGGVGVNWTSEGLAGLWARGGNPFAPGTPLARAGDRAIRRAIDQLRHDYRQQYGTAADTAAFDLLRESAWSVAASPANTQAPLDVQQALMPALDGLLHGHEARQVAWLKRHLLGAVATTFRDELTADPEAWARYHGWLIEQLSVQSATLTSVVEHIPEVRARLSDQGQALQILSDAAETLQRQVAQLQAALDRQASGPPATTTAFHNTDMEIGGNLDQIGGDAGAQSLPGVCPPSTTTFTNEGVKVKGNVTQIGGSRHDGPAAD